MSSIGKNGPIGVAPEVPPEEPKEWDAWFKDAFKALQDKINGSDRLRLSKSLIAEQKSADAYRAIRRARLTREFIESEFWKEFLQPLLSGEQFIKPWSPGDSTDHMTIVSNNLFASGRAAIAKEILKKFGEWVRIGEDAKRIVAAEAEKKKQIKDLG